MEYFKPIEFRSNVIIDLNIKGHPVYYINAKLIYLGYSNIPYKLIGPNGHNCKRVLKWIIDNDCLQYINPIN